MINVQCLYLITYKYCKEVDFGVPLETLAKQLFRWSCSLIWESIQALITQLSSSFWSPICIISVLSAKKTWGNLFSKYKSTVCCFQTISSPNKKDVRIWLIVQEAALWWISGCQWCIHTQRSPQSHSGGRQKPQFRGETEARCSGFGAPLDEFHQRTDAIIFLASFSLSWDTLKRVTLNVFLIWPI